MDIINALALLAPCILGVLVRRIIGRIEEARQNTCDSVRVEPRRQWRKSRPPTRIAAEKPAKQWRKSPPPRMIVAEKPVKQLRELAPTTRMTKKKPVKRRGKFPEWVKQLPERELVERVYAWLRDRPIEEAIKIISGGETIWLSGHRGDEDFNYSEEGRDLIPVTLYHN